MFLIFLTCISYFIQIGCYLLFDQKTFFIHNFKSQKLESLTFLWGHINWSLIFLKFCKHEWYRGRLDRAFASAFSLLFFFSRVFELFECCGYCSCTVQWTVTANFDFSNLFQPITAHRILFTDPQISLFSNFFIKNESHDTIHTFKNYFATVFFNFQFQFSVFNCIQTDPKSNFVVFKWFEIFVASNFLCFT